MWPFTDTPGPWLPYGVSNPSSDPGWTNPECVPLRVVYHVAHIETARRIVVDRAIRARLISDESRLNTERIRVVWLSPNDWSRGSIYGNVRFAFDWRSIIEDFQAYWVETMDGYNPPACRILLTRKNYDGKLIRYDPTGSAGVGPWAYDQASDTHYWNGRYTLEVMLEDDLDLAEAHSIDFVDHHPRICSANRGLCSERGQSRLDAGARFVALIAAQGISVPGGLLTREEDGKVLPTTALSGACQWIWPDLARAPVGTLRGQVPAETKMPLARAVLHAVSRQDTAEMHRLTGLFESGEDLLRSTASLFQAAFGLDPEVDLRWRGFIS